MMGRYHDIAGVNKRHWEEAVRTGAGCTRPWLALDVGSYRAYAERRTTALPRPHCDDAADRMVMQNVQGKDVLCLAAGGGQQSAVFSLLGARVTVFDLCEGQLAGDRKAAAHYGYEVTTVQGDMRDLSPLGSESQDVVYNMGMAWVPDAPQVYREVVRVLRPGGLHLVQFTNPAVEFVCPDSWDGEGYRITVPYAQRGEQTPQDGIQFRHCMGDVFNGLLAAGLALLHVQDTALGNQPDAGARPGSWAHWLAYVPGIAIVARKG